MVKWALLTCLSSSHIPGKRELFWEQLMLDLECVEDAISFQLVHSLQVMKDSSIREAIGKKARLSSGHCEIEKD